MDLLTTRLARSLSDAPIAPVSDWAAARFAFVIEPIFRATAPVLVSGLCAGVGAAFNATLGPGSDDDLAVDGAVVGGVHHLDDAFNAIAESVLGGGFLRAAAVKAVVALGLSHHVLFGGSASTELIVLEIAVPLVHAAVDLDVPVGFPSIIADLVDDLVVSAGNSQCPVSVAFGTASVFALGQVPLALTPGADGLDEAVGFLDNHTRIIINLFCTNVERAAFDLANTALAVWVLVLTFFDIRHRWTVDGSVLKAAVIADAGSWVALTTLSPEAQAFAVVLKDTAVAFADFLFGCLAEHAVRSVEHPGRWGGDWQAWASAGLLNSALFPHDAVWWPSAVGAGQASLEHVLASGALFCQRVAAVSVAVDVFRLISERTRFSGTSLVLIQLWFRSSFRLKFKGNAIQRLVHIDLMCTSHTAVGSWVLHIDTGLLH